jgi:chemotaxis response regulator CheB
MAKIRVLVVEDSLTVRKRMLEVLAADSEIEIAGEAADGKRGIELCQQLRPDVVTLDMMLPIMSGLAATDADSHRLRLDEPGRAFQDVRSIDGRSIGRAR